MTDREKTTYDDYRVGYNEMNRKVHVMKANQNPEPGFKVVGEFRANPYEGKIEGEEDFPNEEGNILFAKSRRIIEDLGVTDFQNMVYEDKSPRATEGGYVLSHKEREDAIADGVSPDVRRAEIGDNLREAAEKFDDDKPKKKTSTRKSTAKRKTATKK